MAQPYERLVATDAHELWSRIDEAESRFRELVRGVEETLPVRGSTWTVRDVTGHLVTVLRRYINRVVAETGGLAATPRGVDQLNADELAALSGTRDELLADLAMEMKTVRELFGPDRVDLHATVPFHAGATVDIAAALANLIGEFLIHGWDVARSAGRSWSIGELDARLVLNGVLQIAPSYVKRDGTGSLAVRLDLPDAHPWLLSIARGAAVSRRWQPDDQVDAVLRAPAATMLLAMYSRIGIGTATRRGLRIAGGRRPWRARLLTSLLERP